MSDRPGLCRIHKDAVFGYRKHKEVNDIRISIKDVLIQGSVLGVGFYRKTDHCRFAPHSCIIQNWDTMSRDSA